MAKKKSSELSDREQSIKRAKRLVSDHVTTASDLDALMLDVNEKISAYREARDNEYIEEDELRKREKEFSDVLVKATSMSNLETHSTISKTVNDIYRPMVTDVASKIITEYSAEKPSEIMLAQMAASAYGRYVENSISFSFHQRQSNLSDIKSRYFSLFSKEADRAFRQFQSAISLLKQMKAPSLNVTVKTQTAFVAQNQQVNVDDNSRSNAIEYGINEPK